MFQRNRGYRLVLGDSKTRDAIEITNLNITFEISKTSDNKKSGNSASIEIYNLSDVSLKLLETDYLVCEFYCGYPDIGINRILSGEVVEVITRKSGTDRVTQIRLGEGYVALTEARLNSTVPAGKTVRDVIEEIRQQMPGIVRGIYAGTNINNPVIYGYPLTGTPRAMLQELSQAYKLEYHVDRGRLSVTDEGGLTENSKILAFVLNEDTGLIEIPYTTSPDVRNGKGDSARKSGINFKALLNTEIYPGRIVKIESKNINGYFKVTSTRHYGSYRDNDWYVEGFCEIPDTQSLR